MTAVACSVVPVNPLAPFVALLRFDRERRNRARFQAAQRDWLAGFLAKAVAAVVDAAEGFVNFSDQFALTVAGSKLDSAIGFRGGPIRQVGVILVLLLQMEQRFPGLFEDFLSPRQQASAEVTALALVHKGLFVRRPVAFGPGKHPTHSHLAFVFYAASILPRAGRLIYGCHGRDNI